MKKFIIAAVIVCAAAFTANAQPRAIGARLGYGLEASYQHSLDQNFIEANLGLFGFHSLNVSAFYNFMIAQPAWTPRGEWGFYAGPGAAVGTGFDRYYAASIGIAGQVGLEYTFWFPLQLSVDLRPQVGVGFGDHVNSNGKVTNAWFYGDGLYYGFVPTLSVRYRF